MAAENDSDAIELCRTILSPESESDDRFDAWESLRPWFASKGYHLYHLQPDQLCWYPQHYNEIEPTEPIEPDLFFAEMGDDWDTDQNFKWIHRLEAVYYRKIGFVQDASFRHLCVKLMESDSEEHKILSFLHKNKEEAILNCVMPAVDFLDIGGYSFAIMPRWGSRPDCPWFSTVRQAAKFIQDILKAYSYLHKNFIVYQDIKLANILVNHVAADHMYVKYSEIRRSLKSSNQIKYVLCDFDSSFLLSPPPSGKPIRLPGELSFDIYQEKPRETSQGELDYDPFAFDIGCLGIIFWNLFATNVRNFPLIVPLVDKMITGKLEDRFSAVEALQFVEKHVLGGSTDLLDKSLEPLEKPHSITWDPDYYDKWVDLPAEFVAEWETYKAPRSSCYDIVLRKICTRVYKGYEVIQFFRSRHKAFKQLLI